MSAAILVADDDRAILLTIRSMLEERGYEVATAADGAEARAMIESGSARFSAVLLDWEMPGMTGIELLRHIRRREELSDLPVILETALDSPENIREGIEAGAYYYLTKPFDRGVLSSIVEAAVEDARSRRDLARKLVSFQNPFGTMVRGTFRFRTLAEGEMLALWIMNASPAPQKALAVSELLTNAVEHGNLGIRYEEKSDLLTEGSWSAEVARRLALPEHASKFVEVGIERNGDGMTLLIEDQGEGFDYRKFLTFDEARVFDNHGRGIAMAGLSLGIEYLGKGNRVRVTIPAG